MTAAPIDKRSYQAFVSYSHADRELVSHLVGWLRDVAGIPIWSDERQLAPSATIATELPDAIARCRGMILVVSRDSIASGWVQEEFNQAIHQRTEFDQYRIVPVRVDDAPIPRFLVTTKWIDLADGQLDIDAANALLSGLYHEDPGPEPRDTLDVYMSRTWRSSEAPPADAACELLAQEGFRLIGDSKDQEGFSGAEDRVRSIVGSCGGLVAIAPHRGQGKTSKYILRELEMARDMNVPYLVVADDEVDLPPDLVDSAVGATRFSAEQLASGGGEDLEGIELLAEAYRPPDRPHYAFFSTDFPEEGGRRNAVVRQMIERVTAMPCVFGDDIREGQIQDIISRRIGRAFFVVADITEDNLNTCIEAGIARGAGGRFHLVARGARRRPPFMFRDHQVWFYKDDVELLGQVHRIVYPYRRRVLNRELARSY